MRLGQFELALFSMLWALSSQVAHSSVTRLNCGVALTAQRLEQRISGKKVKEGTSVPYRIGLDAAYLPVSTANGKMLYLSQSGVTDSGSFWARGTHLTYLSTEEGSVKTFTLGRSGVRGYGLSPSGHLGVAFFSDTGAEVYDFRNRYPIFGRKTLSPTGSSGRALNYSASVVISPDDKWVVATDRASSRLTLWNLNEDGSQKGDPVSLAHGAEHTVNDQIFPHLVDELIRPHFILPDVLLHASDTRLMLSSMDNSDGVASFTMEFDAPITSFQPSKDGQWAATSVEPASEKNRLVKLTDLMSRKEVGYYEFDRGKDPLPPVVLGVTNLTESVVSIFVWYRNQLQVLKYQKGDTAEDSEIPMVLSTIVEFTAVPENTIPRLHLLESGTRLALQFDSAFVFFDYAENRLGQAIQAISDTHFQPYFIGGAIGPYEGTFVTARISERPRNPNARHPIIDFERWGISLGSTVR